MREYRPTTSEIVKDSILNVYNPIKDFTGSFVDIFVDISLAPYRIYSAFNNIEESLGDMAGSSVTNKGKELEESIQTEALKSMGAGIGFWGGLVGIYGQAHLYANLIVNEKLEPSEMGLIFLITNAVTAGVELYKNSKEKLIKKNIESKL